MDAAAVERALAAFSADVRRVFVTALGEVRAGTGSKSAYEANSKFEGFQGSFATLAEFHAGAEATLKLGYPNPEAMKGITNEHTAHVSVGRLFVTPNYRIATCLVVEYWWAVDPDAAPSSVFDRLATLRREAAAGGEEQGGGWAGPAAAGDGVLSLVRGNSDAVDIDVDAHTVTFRPRPDPGPRFGPILLRGSNSPRLVFNCSAACSHSASMLC